MAIINTQLLISPPMRQGFIDPNTLLPVVGTVTFFKPDKVALKNVYIQTNNPSDPFIVASNPITLETDGAFPSSMYLYPFDETDNETEELYYIEVDRTDTSNVHIIENFPENFSPTTPSDEDNTLQNLAPAFGFEFPFYDEVFTAVNELSAPSISTYPSQGFEWYKNDPTLSDFYYNIAVNTVGTIDGNPLNLLTLEVDNLGGVQTTHWFGFEFTKANILAGSNVTLTAYIQDASTIAITSLPVVLINGSDKTTLTNVGTVTISTSLDKVTLNFTMPTLDDSDTDFDVSNTLLAFQLPTSQNLILNFTGIYMYEGSEQPNIVPEPKCIGEVTATQFWAKLSNQLSGKNDVREATTDGGELHPIINESGKLGVQNRTGIIFEASVATEFNFAYPLDGTTFVENDIIIPAPVSYPDSYASVNRYFTDASALQTIAGNSFIVSNLTTTDFDIQTVDIAVSYSTWTSSTGNIVITPSTSGQDLPFTAVIDGGNPAQVNFTWTDDFDAEGNRSNGVNFSTFSQQTDVMGVWFGAWALTLNNAVFTDDATIATFVTTAPGSSSTNATATLEFIKATYTSADLKTSALQFPGGNEPSGTGYNNILQFVKDTTGIDSDNNFIWPTQYIIQFHIDDDGINVPSSVKTVTVNLSSSDLSQNTVASAVVAGLGAGDLYNIAVSALPANGDNLQISTSNATIDVLFYDTGSTKPVKISDNQTIWIEFTTSDSVETFVSNLATDLTTKIGGIPLPGDLDLTGTSSALQYYMEI